jgi:putative membrane protein insertion efficiency factor
VKRALTFVLVLPIRVYRRWVSPAFAPRCRYYPTCSRYAEDAIRELGPVRGTILAGYRLLRCNPFSAGGVDELSGRRLFRNVPTRSERATRRALPPADGTGGADLT